MKLTVLGGGNEIGASCIHVEMGGVRLLFDAGMRMHHDDPMPALGMLAELGGVDAILVTHAHADHIGALPFVALMYPDTPVYATPPTLELMRVMMQDSYRILEARCRLENRLTPYTEQQMHNFLSSVLAFPAGGQIRIGGVAVQAYRAGHILGAVMFGLSDGSKKLLITGDISVRSGRTIAGVKVPYDLHPDVVVMESTYGNRVHIDRNMEEKRLAEHVAEVVAAGGFALIPAFALGRSQEILLILQDYMDKGLIPSFPIYVDGMVTPICRIYRGYPQYLKGPLAHRIRQHEDAFLSEGRCTAVRDVKHREQILQGKPGCIVASSGMLIGGASLWYAERLVGSPQHAIFITGYQDEESPGRRLLSLAEETDGTLEINGTFHQVRCRIDKYGLSAHADAMEMTRFIEELGPAHTLLVHGDDDARFQLAQRLDPRFGPVLVENSVTYAFAARESGKGLKGKNYRSKDIQSGLDEWIGHVLLLKDEGSQLYPAICIGIHAKMRTLICQSFHKSATVKVAPTDCVESLGAWHGSVLELEQQLPNVAKFNRPLLEATDWQRLDAGHHYDLDEACAALGVREIEAKLAVALALQALPDSCVYPPRKDASFERTRYVLNEQVIDQLQELQLPIQGLHMDSTAALNSVRELLQGHPRFIRCGGEGSDKGEPSIVIYFDFPDAVGDEERDAIAKQLARQTGWTVRFSGSVRQDQLVQLARSMLGASLASNPSIHLQTRQLIVDCGELPPDWEQLQKQFRETTGYHLTWKTDAGAGHPTRAAAATDTIVPVSRRQPMENNLALQEVKRWAQESVVTVYKAGIHQTSAGPCMELHFISPQVGSRFANEMARLAERIGMSLSYARNPKQNEILAIAKELFPASWGITKNPSIHTDKEMVHIKVNSDIKVDPTELEEISGMLLEQTGYGLYAAN